MQHPSSNGTCSTMVLILVERGRQLLLLRRKPQRRREEELRRKQERVIMSRGSWRNVSRIVNWMPTLKSSLEVVGCWLVSHPDQVNLAELTGGYILEGKELEFYMKKLQRKKGKGAGAAA